MNKFHPAKKKRSKTEANSRSRDIKKGARHNLHADPEAGGKLWSEEELLSFLDNSSVTPFLLILDGIQDPQNLGACLRSADGAGVHAVIAPKDRAVSLTRAAILVSCGAAENVPYVQVTNLARLIEELKKRNIWLVGTDDKSNEKLYEFDLTGPIAVVVGSEGKGMRRLTREKCDFLASIPMAGKVESLNVSVATGICLYEVVRQRELTTK